MTLGFGFCPPCSIGFAGLGLAGRTGTPGLGTCFRGAGFFGSVMLATLLKGDS